MEMRDEVLSSAAAKHMDTSRYQVSDLDDVEFYWEKGQLDVDAVFRPSINTPFSPPTSNQLQIGSMTENPILIGEEQDKGNSPPHSTTLGSERPTHSPVLTQNRPFGRRIQIVLE